MKFLVYLNYSCKDTIFFATMEEFGTGIFCKNKLKVMVI